MQEYQFVDVRPGLEHQWDYEVNPDGTKTLLVRPDLGFEQTMVMINDLLHDRFDGCIVLSALGSHSRDTCRCTTLAAAIAASLQEMAEHGAQLAECEIIKPRAYDAHRVDMRACTPRSRREQRLRVQRWT